MSVALLWIAQVVRLAIPYLFAAAGGVIAERAGVMSLTLEGFMLGGAFGAALGGSITGNAWGGIAGGMVGGAAFALVHAVACIRFRADQVVTGIAINILALGLTRFLLQLVFHSAANSARIAGFATAGSDGSALAALVRNPLVVGGIISAPLVQWLVQRTPFGLRLRAAGEHPEAAASAGVIVGWIRTIAVLLSGVLAGLGGAYLALDQHQFTEGMTAGRGFIALAAVIFGRWQPLRAAAACFMFAAAEAIAIDVQGTGAVPSQWLQMIPYVLTIVALVRVVGRATPPAALGRSR